MTNAIRTLSPATNAVIFEHPGTTAAEARSLAQAAHDALPALQKLSLAERKAIIVKALDLIDADKEVLSAELTAQMGRPIAYCAKEIDTMRMRAEYLLSIVDEKLADIPGQAQDGFRRCVKKAPVGVTLIATAWNVSLLHPYPTPSARTDENGQEKA